MNTWIHPICNEYDTGVHLLPRQLCHQPFFFKPCVSFVYSVVRERFGLRRVNADDRGHWGKGNTFHFVCVCVLCCYVGNALFRSPHSGRQNSNSLFRFCLTRRNGSVRSLCLLNLKRNDYWHDPNSLPVVVANRSSSLFSLNVCRRKSSFRKCPVFLSALSALKKVTKKKRQNGPINGTLRVQSTGDKTPVSVRFLYICPLPQLYQLDGQQKMRLILYTAGYRMPLLQPD